MTLMSCAGATANIRATLQRYKNNNPPETEVYEVSARDLLDMLTMTGNLWVHLEQLEKRMNKIVDMLGRSNI